MIDVEFLVHKPQLFFACVFVDSVDDLAELCKAKFIAFVEFDILKKFADVNVSGVNLNFESGEDVNTRFAGFHVTVIFTVHLMLGEIDTC